MTHHMDHDRARRQQQDQQRAQAIQDGLFKKAVQEALGNPNVRLMLWEFLQQMGLDASPFSGNGPAQAHAIGQQDAARWWLNVIRRHCPEREAQIRNEGVARDKQARNQSTQQEESDES